MRNRTVTTSLVGLALVVAFAAPAAAQGPPVSTRPLLGAGVSFLTDGSETGTGFAVVKLADGVDYDEVVAKTAAPVQDARQRCSAASSVRERTPSLA